MREPAADKAAWESQQPREQCKRAAEVTATKAPTTKATLELKRQIAKNSRRLSGRQNLPFLYTGKNTKRKRGTLGRTKDSK